MQGRIFMTKKCVCILLFIVAVVTTLSIIHFIGSKKEPTKYDNLFAHAVSYNNTQNVFKPAEFDFYVSIEDVLTLKKWNEDVVFDYENNEGMKVIHDKISISGIADEISMGYIFYEDKLISLGYNMQIKPTDYETVLQNLYHQAKASMPERPACHVSGNGPEDIKVGKGVSWMDAQGNQVMLDFYPSSKDESVLIRLNIHANFREHESFSAN